MAYVGQNPYNIPVPPYYPNPPVPPCPPPGPHGKLPNDGFLINYEGLKTDTAEVIVNNENRTIRVNVDPQGVDSATTFVYSTPHPMSSWEIDHNMNKYPSVMLVDQDNNVIGADIKYINKNKIVVNLSEAICGRAFLG